MIINRLLILQVVLALGLSSVFLVPKKAGIGPAGIALTLPADVGMWTGSDAAVSAAELQGLAPDTGFARRLYTDPFGDQIFVSIVLSGTDMANSIHRPERCLPAQGWTVEHSSVVQIPMLGAPLAVTKLSNIREARLKNDPTPITVRQLDYYWFIGSRDVTPSTWERTYIDVKDRMLHGENQRWAYVTVSSNVTDNLQRFGKSEAETSKMVQDFIAEIVPHFQRPELTDAASR
jgi:EpsI family protein